MTRMMGELALTTPLPDLIGAVSTCGRIVKMVTAGSNQYELEKVESARLSAESNEDGTTICLSRAVTASMRLSPEQMAKLQDNGAEVLSDVIHELVASQIGSKAGITRALEKAMSGNLQVRKTIGGETEFSRPLLSITEEGDSGRTESAGERVPPPAPPLSYSYYLEAREAGEGSTSSGSGSAQVSGPLADRQR